MAFKKYILVFSAVLFFGVTGFSENQTVFGKKREVVNQAGSWINKIGIGSSLKLAKGSKGRTYLGNGAFS